MFVNMKNTTRTQDLREAFASIISMMLGLLRAQGWRGLLHLPEIVMVVFLLRSISKRFIALMDAHAAGTRQLPTPDAAAPQWPAAYSRAAATPRVRAPRSASGRRRPSLPARAVSMRVHAPSRRSAPTPLPRPHVLVRAPDPPKNSVFPASPLHAYFVTISK